MEFSLLMIIIKKTNPNDIYDGCLYYLKDQITFSKDESSRWSSDPIEKIVTSKVDHDAYICASSFPNLTIDLNEKYVLPTSYSLMGRRSCDCFFLQSWELKGRTKDNRWVLLHSQTKNPFSRYSIKNFTLSTKLSYSAFKISMTDKSYDGNYGGNLCLNIGHIEIFGIIYDTHIIYSEGVAKNLPKNSFGLLAKKIFIA